MIQRITSAQALPVMPLDIGRRGFIAEVEARQPGATAGAALQLLVAAPLASCGSSAAMLAPAVPAVLDWALRLDLSAAELGPSVDPGLRRLTAAAMVLEHAKHPAAYGIAALGAAAGLEVSDAVRLTLQLARRLDAKLDRRLAARATPSTTTSSGSPVTCTVSSAALVT